MSNNSCNIRMTSKAVSQVTMPSQPTFLAFLSSTVNNVTGDNTPYTLAADSEVFDQGSDYNNTTYTFTAPVNGNYIFATSARIQHGASGTGSSTTPRYKGTSYGDFRFEAVDGPGISDASMYMSFANISFINMTAGDTLYTTISVLNVPSSKVSDIYGANPNRITTFGGALV